MTNKIAQITKHTSLLLLLLLLMFVPYFLTQAATLGTAPATGVYTSGQTFNVSVVLNTQGKSINAAEGTLKFNPNQFSVVGLSKGSLFNLWTAEPSFSNSAGTISFSGGNPTGYSGSNGVVLTVTMRALGSGSGKLQFQNGSVLAADGMGTNVLTSMNSGTYTITAPSAVPEQETVIEYVPSANTPGKPVVSSDTHPTDQWSNNKQASLSWSLPAGVTQVRTLLNTNQTSVPTKVYDPAVSSIELDLDEGVQYLHIQFKNDDGWGVINHYKLAVDTIAPTDFSLDLADGVDTTSPNQRLKVNITEDGSGIEKYLLKIDDFEPFEYVSEEEGYIDLVNLEPGYHTIIVEAFDFAGNSVIGTKSVTVEAFEAPIFTEYPNQLSTNVIPVIKGMTRPHSSVSVSIKRINSSDTDSDRVYSVTSDDSGEFIVIPDGRLQAGVYELSAFSVDDDGAKSESSNVNRMIVEQPGYLKIGSVFISVLSVLIPLIALVFLLIFSLWYFVVRFRKVKRVVTKESLEAIDILHREFGQLGKLLEAQKNLLMKSRKSGKLTKSEENLIVEMSQALLASEEKVRAEIEDVSEVVE